MTTHARQLAGCQARHTDEGTPAAQAGHACPVNRPPENFFLSEDPITSEPLLPPQQLELEPKPKTEGQFTKEANKLINRHKGGLKDD